MQASIGILQYRTAIAHSKTAAMSCNKHRNIVQSNGVTSCAHVLLQQRNYCIALVYLIIRHSIYVLHVLENMSRWIPFVSYNILAIQCKLYTTRDVRGMQMVPEKQHGSNIITSVYNRKHLNGIRVCRPVATR